jgi:hypothetical protein
MNSPPRTRLFVVDRVEGRGATARVILVSDSDEQVEIVRSALGDTAVEGAVLRVPFAGANPDWSRAERDRDEERRRMAAATEQLKRLRANDPGGDLEL